MAGPVQQKTNSPSGVRVDSWLWAVRVYKTRSLATTACRAGHVRVNGERVKAAQTVRIGDEVRSRIAGFDRILVVKGLSTKRGSATAAAECFTDLTPPPPPRESVAFVPVRDRGAGRPTKRDRRELERLRGAHGSARGSGFEATLEAASESPDREAAADD